MQTVPRKLAPLAFTVCAIASATASCTGNLATSTTIADAGPDVGAGPGPDAGSAGAPPPSALRRVSLAMTQVNFDSPTADAWKTIGFNLDGKVTTATSTDVCQLLSAAAPATQDDGQDGIDNSYGENICPIWDSLDMQACSTRISQTYVVTDASGSGTLTIQIANLSGFRMNIPISDAYVVLNDDGSGMLGAVSPTNGLGTALAGAIEGICHHQGDPQSIIMQFEQASDIVANGSNSAGQPCDAISIGMQFWEATPFDGVLPEPDACPTD